MLDVKTDDEEYAPTMKGTGASRMQRDKEDVNKLVYRTYSISCLLIRHQNTSTKWKKIAGGLVVITRSDNARDQWCLTFNERSRLVNETCAMLDVKTEDEEYSPTMKETGASRMQRDKEDR